VTFFAALCWFFGGAIFARAYIVWIKWDPYKDRLDKQSNDMASLYTKAISDLVETETARTDGFLKGVHMANEAWKARLEEAYEKQLSPRTVH